MLVNMCRICGRSNICDKSLNLFETCNRKLLGHINMLTEMQLKELNDAPAFICFGCQMDLKIAMAFRKRCIKTQKKWQPSEQIGVESSSSNEESYRQKIKWRTKRKAHRAKAVTESEDDGQPQRTLQIMLKEEVCVNIARDEFESEHDHLDLSCGIKLEETSSSDDEYNPPVVVPNSSKIYICEQCGTHINTKASFERHILKHTGERPYGCEVCPSRFLSAGELRAHGLTHTGERRFPCRYCERKYMSYMGRLKHERIHTNERPFVCAECGKTFTTSFILKNHMLVHSGERLFRCDLCKRSFQRKTHLKTHYRSNMHQQNVEKQQQDANRGAIT